MAPSLTTQVLREEMERFLQDSLKPELVALIGLSDGARQARQQQISEIAQKVDEIWDVVCRYTSVQIEMKPSGTAEVVQTFSSMSFFRNANSVNSSKSRQHLILKPPSRRPSSDDVDDRERASGSSFPKRRSARVAPAGPDSNASSDEGEIGRVSGRSALEGRRANFAPIGSNTSSDIARLNSGRNWMNRHRMLYESIEESEPKLSRAVEAALQEEASPCDSANTGWLGGMGARLMWRRHNESYRKLHLLRENVVNAAGAQPDPLFDSEVELQTPIAPRTRNSYGNDLRLSSIRRNQNIEAEDPGSPMEYRASHSSRSRRKSITRYLSKELAGEEYDFEDPPVNLPKSDMRRQSDESPRLIVRVSNMILSHEFACVVAFLVIANALVLGLETDYMARYWTHDVPLVYVVAERFFCTCFVVEIALRLYVFRLDFFTMSSWPSNVFDLVVLCVQLIVLLDVYEYIMGLKNSNIKGEIRLEVPAWRTLLLVRLARLVRLVRVTNLLHLLAELRMLVVSITDTLKSVLWVLFLLVLMMYCMGVCFTEVVTLHKLNQARPSEETRFSFTNMSSLEHYYGNLPRTMLTLFETIASGVSWEEAADPLAKYCSVWMLFPFVAYVFFTMFVFLNVVTGVFVSFATEKASDDRKKILMLQLRKIFREVDADTSGIMSWTAFQHHLWDDKVQMYLKAVDLHQEEALDLFRLLDVDDSGEIDEDEFVNGCMRLHGNAKAIDLAAFMFDYKNWTRLWSEHAARVETTLNNVQARFSPS